jgi:pimeloyl-ACP methyl ester carboxylesterase
MPTVDVNGVRIAYQDSGGSGTPVVFVHGFPLSAEMWDPQIEVLDDRIRSIAVDLRGFGNSDAPDDRSAYSMSDFAADVKGVVDEAGVERAVLCGLSMGGYVCFEFWRRYSPSVAGLVLADTRAEADPPEAIEKRTSQQQQVAERGIDELADALTNALVSATTAGGKPDVVKRVRALMDQPAAGYIGALEAMKNRPDSSSDLTGITVPCLVIVGEEDGLTPPEMSRKIHEHIGGSQLAVIPEAGHLSNLEDPQAFNGALMDFLERF